MRKKILEEADMLMFGKELASHCRPPVIIFLYGQLGAGKTTLTRGFLRGLGYQEKVKSPTYTIVEPYHFNNYSVFHFDLYRVHDPLELELIGIQDYFTPQSICLIEWPENAFDLLPEADLSCYIEMMKNGREIKLEAKTQSGKNILGKMK